MPYKRSFLAALIVALCLSGCAFLDSPPIPVLYDVLPETAAAESEVKPQTVGVYFDVTPSMAGFLSKPNDAENSMYSICLYELGKLVAGQYDQISYFRVDTPLWQIVGDENVPEEARNPDYYRNSAGFGRDYYIRIGEESDYTGLCLTPALDYSVNQDLFVFVTDFYENSVPNNVNAEAVLSKISELSGRKDGKVFGLIGIKSTFAGKIYDVGVNGGERDYGMDTEENAIRSFYLILRGYPNHVADFCEKMTKRLQTVGAQEGTDYEATVFYEESFPGLDYTSLNECENQMSPRKDFVWPYTTVTIHSETRNSAVEKNVYAYRKGGVNQTGEERILYFSYMVDEDRREAFHTLVAENAETEIVDFLPTGKKELPVIPCSIRGRSAALWDGNETFYVQNTSAGSDGEPFEVLGIYYDEAREVIYAALRMKDSRLDAGIWRFQWESVLGAPAAPDAWWEDWTSQSGPDVDYSKTERLTEYVETIIEKMPRADRTVLRGVAYLSIEEAKR